MATATILVVEDDAAVAWSVEQALRGAGWQVVVAADAAAARRHLKRLQPDVVLTDVKMPGESGLDLAAALRQELPGIPVIVTTAFGTMDSAVAAVAAGAFDYLPKPLELDRLLAVVRRALGEDSLAAAAQPAASTPLGDSDLVGAAPAMQEIYRRLAAAAASDLPVLIVGPPGSGKELAARALHRHSARSAAPFVAVSCGALANADDLFGASGAGAASAGGTLFCDEIEALPAPAQVRLLRLLDEAGAPRVIAASARDLTALSAAGAFRQDLAWRLRGTTVAVPALADRLDDLPALVRHLLSRLAQRLGRALAITDGALARLRRHSWPGNVRELRHVIEEAAVLATGGIIDLDHLDLPPIDDSAGPTPSGFTAATAALARKLLLAHPGTAHQQFTDTVEAVLLREAIARTEGNQLRAAELLGINRITLKKRMDQLGIAGRQD